ncbi:TPA: DUF1642 domain-containing protein [Enterococcus faecalis]|uniref:DUF1642 domain-containing protein n=1 Tax=Enterococcus faecalis TaxID=1351 RepID=UPI000DFDFA42|nr:DUF1642 domain-containing protein [Enterococcus faecalis]STQ20975.1 phage protein, putative [Enterococcus faecalis]HAP5244946.1 DUF1642 domain-containing protein [Enterococcus faecalis]
MNNQKLIDELIYELENVSSRSINKDFEDGYNGGIRHALELVKEKKLDEPKKVVVPKFVAEWIGYATLKGDSLIASFKPWDLYGAEYGKVNSWIKDNEETYARAWLDGYEVLEEPLYYVKIPLTEWNDDTSELETKYVYLTEDITSEEIRLQASNAEHGDWKVKLTEERVKSIDERYWPFAVKVGNE